MHKLFYATTNPGKFSEVERFLAQHAPEYKVCQYEEDLLEIQTDNQEVIAAYKAQQAWDKLKKPVLVDDAGIYFEKYKEFPGTMSKFVYYAIGFEGLFKLVEPGDKAFFKVTVAYAYGDGLVETFEDTCFGTIARPAETGALSSLPYLAIFVPDGETQTFAELRTTNKMHHYNPRSNAIKKFIQWHAQRD